MNELSTIIKNLSYLSYSFSTLFRSFINISAIIENEIGVYIKIKNKSKHI